MDHTPLFGGMKAIIVASLEVQVEQACCRSFFRESNFEAALQPGSHNVGRHL